MQRVTRFLAAGALGVVVALLILVLRPNGSTFDAEVEPRSLPASIDRAAAANRVAAAARPTEPALPATAAEVGAAAAAASGDAVVRAVGLTSNAVSDSMTPPGASGSRGDASRPDEGGVSADEEGPERPALWCFLKTRDDHDYVSDASAVWNGSRSVWIGKQNDAAADGGYFSTDVLWQGVDATAFRGRRIEVSVQVRGRGYFQFFVRTAAAADTGIVLHDSQLPTVPTTNRYVNLFPPRGEWERLSIVADVPLEADVVYYGIALNGGRAIWIDDFRLAPVEPPTPLTAEPSAGGRFILPVDARAVLPAPSNLDFEVTTRDTVGCQR